MVDVSWTAPDNMRVDPRHSGGVVANEFKKMSGQKDSDRAKKKLGQLPGIAQNKADAIDPWIDNQVNINEELVRKTGKQNEDLLAATGAAGDQLKSSTAATNQEWKDTQTGNVRDFRTTSIKNLLNFEQEADNLKNQMDSQYSDITTAYDQGIIPEQKNLMEKFKTDVDNRLTLSEAQDPNNRIAQATRDMYNQQASNFGREGMAQAGIINAMGDQSSANAFASAGVPMTGSQMQGLMAQNRMQGSQAMQNTQNYMNSLRQQGIDMGFARTDQAYNQGLNALSGYGQAIQGLEAQNLNRLSAQQGITGMQSNLANQVFGAQQGVNQGIFGAESGLASGIHQNAMNQNMMNHGLDVGQATLGHSLGSNLNQMKHGLTSGVIGMRMGQAGAPFDVEMQSLGQQANVDMANAAGNRQMLGSLIGAGATIGGAMMMGPAAGGAGLASSAASGAASGAASSMMAPPPVQAPPTMQPIQPTQPMQQTSYLQPQINYGAPQQQGGFGQPKPYGNINPATGMYGVNQPYQGGMYS